MQHLQSRPQPRRRDATVAVVGLILALSACKPVKTSPAESSPDPSGPRPAPGQSVQPSLALAGEQSHYPVITDESLALTRIIKRLMGLNPDQDDKQDHIGLINIADMMGYEYPAADCPSGWQLALGGDVAAPVYSVTSQHDHGSSAKCQEPRLDVPVKYLFQGWNATAIAVVPLPFTVPVDPTDLPQTGGATNAESTLGPTVRINPDGQLLVLTEDTVKGRRKPTGSSTTSATYHVEYTRQLGANHRIATASLASPVFGFAVAYTANAGYSFSLAPPSKAPPPPPEFRCAADVQQPAGCFYDVSLTANYTATRARYRALLQVKPRAVGLRGGLRRTGDCENRDYRRDGSCGGTMGDDGRGVEQWFGNAADNRDFAVDLASQIDANGGSWDWAAMRALPLQQNQGIPNLDWALRYFQQGDYGAAALDFADTSEAVTSCTLHVKVEPGSQAGCTSIQDGATVLPDGP